MTSSGLHLLHITPGMFGWPLREHRKSKLPDNLLETSRSIKYVVYFSLEANSMQFSAVQRRADE